MYYEDRVDATEVLDLGEVLGRGKYGTVRAAGLRSVVKTIELRTKDEARWKNKARQSYREYVVGIIQSLIVQRRHNPHLVIHYGGKMRLSGDIYGLSLKMERFEGSLDQGSDRLFSGDAAWRSMFFQVTSGLAAMAILPGVVHNDLYPRNVLFRVLPRAIDADYVICGQAHRVRHEVFYAIADFGICGSPLLDCGKECKPDMRLSMLQTPTLFGQTPSDQHILKYADLPPFSRDVYVLYKWPRGGISKIATVPLDIGRWAQSVLSHIDQNLAEFKRPSGIVNMMAKVFDVERMPTSSPPSLHHFSVSEGDRDALLSASAKGIERGLRGE